MVRIGPSGNDVKFYADGNKSSIDAPQWLSKMRLTAYEISFGRGIRMTEKTAQIIGAKAREFGVEISVHAPYYINLANLDALEKNYHYIKRSLELLALMGGKRLVIHVGSQMQLSRAVALANCRQSLVAIMQRLTQDNLTDGLLCIETMGKYTQIGNLDEICDLCQIDKRIIPTVDLGHLNCLAQGKLDLEQVFKKIAYFDQVHFHISFIEFGAKGEIRHLTFAEQQYGFDLRRVMQLIKQRQKCDTVICECAQIMAQDSVKLLDFYLQ